MDAVGHVSDRDLFRRPVRKQRLEQMPAHLAMQATHAIHRPAAANRQISHVERFRRIVRILAAQGQQIVAAYTKLRACIPAEVLLDQRRRETIEAGSHRRVRGEQIARTGDGQRDLEVVPGFLHETARTFQHRERRMPFVQVADFRLDAERREQPPSANPEQHFLFQAQLRPAAVKLAGNAAMHRVIRCIIAVQQVQLHATDLNLPGAQPDRVTRQRDLQPQPLAVRFAQRA